MWGRERKGKQRREGNRWNRVQLRGSQFLGKFFLFLPSFFPLPLSLLLFPPFSLFLSRYPNNPLHLVYSIITLPLSLSSNSIPLSSSRSLQLLMMITHLLQNREKSFPTTLITKTIFKNILICLLVTLCPLKEKQENFKILKRFYSTEDIIIECNWGKGKGDNSCKEYNVYRDEGMTGDHDLRYFPEFRLVTLRMWRGRESEGGSERESFDRIEIALWISAHFSSVDWLIHDRASCTFLLCFHSF